MKITKKTIKASAETTFEEFNQTKTKLENLSSYTIWGIGDTITAYVVLKNNGIEASKILSVNTDEEQNYCHIDYEEDIEDSEVERIER